MTSWKLVDDFDLFKAAAKAKQGRQFWTGPSPAFARLHLQSHPADVCLVPYQEQEGETPRTVLLGGPIPTGTLVDVTTRNLAVYGDSFDIGEMSNLAREWFQREHQTEVTIYLLESGEMTTVGPNAKLICLSRETPALLDMATTDGNVIGQYSQTGGVMGHTGDYHSTIGGVKCLHHEAPLKPHNAKAKQILTGQQKHPFYDTVKRFIIAGYSSKPLKAWRDSRVFWMAYDPDAVAAFLVPHNLSHDAVGDHVSASMPLVSKQDSNGRVQVFHLSHPVQATLTSASPIKTDNQAHNEFLKRCKDAAESVNWSQQQQATAASTTAKKTKTDDSIMIESTSMEQLISINRTIALYDGCRLEGSLWNTPSFPTTKAGNPKVATSISTRHGPLKVLARGCCAYDRVVMIDAASTAATSEINSVDTLLSGVILVQMTGNPDIYRDMDMVRWNSARGIRTPVVAITQGEARHLVGPFPPKVAKIEDYPTPVAGTPIPAEALHELIQFALSPESDDYFGPLYQPVPGVAEVTQAFREWKDSVADKDFCAILSEELANVENAFDDNDFRSLMEWINMLSVSSASAVERNNLAVFLVKFLKGKIKLVAERELRDSPTHQKDLADLALLKEWMGDNMDWAVSKKDTLEELIKESSIKIKPQEGVVDIALQEKLNAAIQKKKSSLDQKVRSAKRDTPNKMKRIFNAVFNPALEALARCIGENPRFQKFFPPIKNPNLSGIVATAAQSSAKSAMQSADDIMKIFHELGASGFISFRVNFLKTWKAKVINQICVVDKPGQGFNDPQSFVPLDHRIEDGPEDPESAYEMDIRHQFVLPIFARLPKSADDNEDEDDYEEEELKKMPIPLAEADLAEFVLMRSEFMLRDPEQGTKHPMWRYADWLFSQIKTLHQVAEKQAAPLVMRALGYSILQIMKTKPNPDKMTMETVASIIQSISFISARGNPVPHAALDTFFNMAKRYVPLSKDLEQNPWQIETVNILSRAVDYVRPIMTAREYRQVRSNFQRAAANTVKRQIVQKLLEDIIEERKKNTESNEDYVARVNSEFYPAYREIVETIGMLLDADPETFELTDELCERIDSLHDTVVVKWANNMRRCRVGPVRVLVSALKEFRKKGPQAMKYLVSRKPYLSLLYDQVYHIKYESCDQVIVEELCKIIRAKGRNPNHDNHPKWLTRVDAAIEDVLSYDSKMFGYAHGNQYKSLPTSLMMQMLTALKDRPTDDDCVTFSQVQELLAHMNIHVEKFSDLKVSENNPDGKKSVWEQLRGEWWMCPDVKPAASTASPVAEGVPDVALIPMVESVAAPSSNILAVLGDTYHKFKVARLFSSDLVAMRTFIGDNYKFHVEWFEDTIRAAGFPGNFDPNLVENHEAMAIYAVTQRLVHELVQNESDRGEQARENVYGEVWDPLALTEDDAKAIASSVGLLEDSSSAKKD